MSEDQPPHEDSEPTRSSGRNGDDGPLVVGTSVPGKRLGDFELLRELGRGGMGIVYEARQLSLNRRVALKVLPPGLGLSDTAVQRFEREARAAAKLHHTNIVPVHAIGEESGCHYYAMELIEGQPLSAVLRDLGGGESSPLLDETVARPGAGESGQDKSEVETSRDGSGVTSLSEASSSSRQWFDAVARLIAEVADALDYAHGRGVIHRDIKPANLMLSRAGRLCITDFGLARMAQEPGMTVSGSLLGTPAYMSPEQVAVGRMKLDHRTDIYSLGAVLYEMLAQRRPFPGKSRDEILGSILTKDPRPPRRFNARIPLDLETICQKAMEKDPDRRYQDAKAFAADLRRFLQRGLITARRAGLARRARKLIRRHPVAATATALSLAFLIIIASVIGLLSEQRAQERVRRTVSETRHLIDRGDYREALARSEEALRLAPKLPEARLLRAQCLLELRHFSEAVNESLAVLAQEPDDWAPHLVLATVAARHGNRFPTLSAEIHLAAVEANAPDTADVYYLRGQMADKAVEAIPLLDRALELDPSHDGALLERSRRHTIMKNFPAALADAERLLGVLPDSALGRRQIADAYALQHDEERALAEYTRAIELDTRDPVTYRRRAALYAEMGRDDARLQDCTRALELDPDSSEYLWRRARALYALARYYEAIDDARRSVEIHSEDMEPYEVLALALDKQGRRDDALATLARLRDSAESWADDEVRAEAYGALAEIHRLLEDNESSLSASTAAIEIEPDKFIGYLQRAQTLRVLGRSEEKRLDCERASAIELTEPGEYVARGRRMDTVCDRPDLAREDYASAQRLAPQWADPHLRRGQLLILEGRDEDGTAELARAVELAPRWLNAQFGLAQAYALQERFEEALAGYERLFELGGEGGSLRWRQARALARLGRSDEAVEVMNQVIEDYPDVESYHRWRAELFYRLGRVDEAVAALGRAVEVQPGSPWPYAWRAVYAVFQPGACPRVASDAAKALELNSQDPGIWQSIGYLHAGFLVSLCPDLYDADLALRLGRRATEYSPREPGYQKILGLALYRRGSFREAHEAFMAAGELEAWDIPNTMFLLAMTSFRLGERGQAGEHYERAVERARKTYPDEPSTVYFRDEAAGLLGIRR